MFEIIGLLISTIICLYLFRQIKNKITTNNVTKMFRNIIAFLTLWCLMLLLQKIALIVLPNVNPIYFDYVVYISICIVPVEFVRLSFELLDKKISKNTIKLLYVIPIICLIVLWTNDLHSLFYEVYSIDFSKTVYGPFFTINSIYSYIMFAVFIICSLIATIKKSGFISAPTAILIASVLVPIMVNVLGVLRIIEMSIYITPMTFIVTLVGFYIAVFKFKALNITPIATRTVINTISDGYVLISNDGTIIDRNKAFGEMFTEIEINNLFYEMQKRNMKIDYLKEGIEESKANNGNIAVFQREFIINNENKFYEVEISAIKDKSGDEYVATLILFKDVTQHKIDIQTIQDKQEMLVKQGQLASIGELAGGVAHDINTPVSAIKTGLGMLESMYEARDENEKQLLYRMNNCTDKIITIVNSMRNQIHNLDSNEKVEFNISEVINDVKIISYNALQKNGCNLEINMDKDIKIYGNKTKLGQVITNLVINAMQAYDGGKGEIKINVKINSENKALIQVVDFAGGIPESIKDSIFKNILTTKGVNGTGLGLYLAYSIIKGEFDGEIDFESKDGKGTTFNIILDVLK